MESNRVEFLFLSQKDMIEAGVLDMQRCVDVMEEAFKLMNQGDYLLGGPSQNHHGMKLWLPKKPRGPRMPVAGPDRRFMAMMAYVGGRFNVAGAKWYGSNIENPAKRGLPRSVLLVILNDAETGAPLAIMDGNLISAMRTGSVIGLGARYLARKDATIGGVIAAGVISRTCLMALAVGAKNLREVKVYDIDRSKAEGFSKEMSQKLGLKVYPVETMEEAIRGSDIVSSATSRLKRPSFEARWFKEGSFFGLSADADIEEDHWLNSKIVADNWKMHLDWREEIEKAPEELRDRILYQNLHDLIRAGKIKESRIAELMRIVSGTVPGREREDQKIILIAGGMGTEDVSWGATVYQRAKEKGLGQKLTLWDEPYWA